MTADEIREQRASSIAMVNGQATKDHQIVQCLSAIYQFNSEIAAQLAELNENLNRLFGEDTITQDVPR